MPHDQLDSLTLAGRDAVGFDVLPPAGQLERSISLDLDPDIGELDERIARDQWPIPRADDREGYYAKRDFDYWLSGLIDYLEVSRLAREHGQDLRAGDRVLELGCASGRVLRHFAAQGPDLDVWGIDINCRHVEFCQAYLGESIKTMLGTTLPMTPLADESCAVVCAFSVFTHIDQFETTWLAEIARILRPGGILYATIHSDRSWQRMGPTMPVYNAIMQNKKAIESCGFTEDLFASPMPRPRIVFQMCDREVYSTNVFHAESHVRTVWGRFLEFRDFIEKGHTAQDVVLLRKRS